MAQPRTDNTGKIQQTAAQPQNGNGKAPPKESPLVLRVLSPGFTEEIKRALPKHVTPERMARIVLTALRTTANLDKCEPSTFMGCVMQAAQLGLDVNTPNGHAWLIPRYITKRNQYECTLIIGYQGQIELALRSGKVEKIWTRVVRAGDHFKVKYGLEEDIEHEPSTHPDREKQAITFVYAVAALKTGGKVFEVLSAPQIAARMARSETADKSFSPWKSDYEAMARKSGVRALFKWLPKSAEMALVEHLEERAEQGRPQVFDDNIEESITRMGYRPIVDTEGESVGGEGDPAPGESTTTYDPETGEVPPAEPGANDKP